MCICDSGFERILSIQHRKLVAMAGASNCTVRVEAPKLSRPQGVGFRSAFVRLCTLASRVLNAYSRGNGRVASTSVRKFSLMNRGGQLEPPINQPRLNVLNRILLCKKKLRVRYAIPIVKRYIHMFKQRISISNRILSIIKRLVVVHRLYQTESNMSYMQVKSVENLFIKRNNPLYDDNFLTFSYTIDFHIANLKVEKILVSN